MKGASQIGTLDGKTHQGVLKSGTLDITEKHNPRKIIVRKGNLESF